MKTQRLNVQKFDNVMVNRDKSIIQKFIVLLFIKENLGLLLCAFFVGRSVLSTGDMPFGLAVYASVRKDGKLKVLVAIFILLGMVSVGQFQNLLITASSIFLFSAINHPLKETKTHKVVTVSFIAAISSVVPFLILAALSNTIKAYFYSGIFNAILVYCIVFILCKAEITGTVKTKFFIRGSEDLVAFGLLSAIAISGIGETLIFGFDVKWIVAVLSVMMFSYKFGSGIGASLGIMIGIIMGMTSLVDPIIVGTLGACGMVAGWISSMSGVRYMAKMATVIGFLAGSVFILMYMSNTDGMVLFTKEILISGVLFILIPRNMTEKFFEHFYFVNSVRARNNYSTRIKEVAFSRLNRFANAIKELSRSYSHQNRLTETEEICGIDIKTFERIAEVACKKCERNYSCFGGNPVDRISNISKVFVGYTTNEDSCFYEPPAEIIAECPQIEELMNRINLLSEMVRLEGPQKDKMFENRTIVSAQLEGLSNVVINLADEINLDVKFKSGYEGKLLKALANAGIRVRELTVLENRNGQIEISILQKGCNIGNCNLSRIEEVVSMEMGRKMIKDKIICNRNNSLKLCRLKLVEKEYYCINTGVAKAIKHNGTISGDQYTFVDTREGKYVVALSDGMGSGKNAKDQSSKAVNMLEKFMDAGFGKDISVRLVNSLLMLNTNSETHATLDLAVVDLYNGEVEFVKIGAAPTFIRRQDRVEALSSVSLPAGILGDMDFELVKKQLSGGDFIIMVSDGVFDHFSQSGNKEDALKNFIQDIKSQNPHNIADLILKEACKTVKNDPPDDFTVLVAKVVTRVL